MASLVSELTSHGWKNEWIKGYIASLDPLLVIVADMIFIRALLICCVSIDVRRKNILAYLKFSSVLVVSILVMFVSGSTFLLILSLLWKFA